MVAQQVPGRSGVNIYWHLESDHRVTQDDEIGTAAGAIDGVGCGRVAAGRLIAVVEARCPPAEKPIIPMRSGEISNSLARLRTSRIALCASPNSMGW